MKISICGGRVVDPANQIDSELNLLLDGGKVAAVTTETPQADLRIDACGKIVSPGFVDIHMHEDPVDDGKLYTDNERAIFHCMLRMGVTTAVGGNCGENKFHPADYLDLVDRDGAAVNVAMLAGHEFFRLRAGCTNKYAPATAAQKDQMAREITKSLRRGCAGVSYGIRYVPGIDMGELIRTAQGCQAGGKPIAAHIRSDAEEIYDAAREFLDAGAALGVPVQISHIGSMAGFGQMEKFLSLVDGYKTKNKRISCDCYPYAAFSTGIGSTTYDPGWLERYGCDYSVVELCEGKYKGQRCTKEIFEELRRDFPETMTVCYVMQAAEVERAYRHPGVMLGSDGTLSRGQGHPRAAGAFPKLLADYVRPGKMSLYEAINKMSTLPARQMGFENKGKLSVGADADIVIFDLDKVQDRATFASPVLPPAGIDWVLVNGQLAAVDGSVINGRAGRAVRVY